DELLMCALLSRWLRSLSRHLHTTSTLRAALPGFGSPILDCRCRAAACTRQTAKVAQPICDNLVDCKHWLFRPISDQPVSALRHVSLEYLHIGRPGAHHARQVQGIRLLEVSSQLDGPRLAELFSAHAVPPPLLIDLFGTA